MQRRAFMKASIQFETAGQEWAEHFDETGGLQK